jgi:hypothetical protein
MESLFDFLSTLEFRPCLLNRRDWLNISKKGGWLDDRSVILKRGFFGAENLKETVTVWELPYDPPE